MLPPIIYQDDEILIVNKPHDLLSVPGLGPDKQDCLISRLQSDYPSALIVHRLDYATSGLMVIALSKASHRHLSIQFQNRVTEKRYQAIISGQPEQSSGQVDLPLRCDWDRRPLQMVCYEHGKNALTHWQVTDRMDNDCRVALTPITGRSHQLRVHMLALGHPIIGDEFYAPDDVKQQSNRLLLHAEMLAIRHPVTNEKMCFESTADF